MIASMWFLPGVYLHILCKIRIFNFVKSLFTITTLIWFLQCVFSYALQDYLYIQNLLTVSAWIWSFPCVYLHMISKMTSLYKSHLTMAAIMWFLPCMYLDILITITALHSCGFSPDCIFICFVSLLLLAKAFSQNLQWCGPTSLCITIFLVS